MDLVLLGGNSPKNKSWVEEIKQSVSDVFDTERIQYYNHWDDPNKGGIDFELELSRLPKTIEGLGNYVAFAKSAGVLLALKAINQQIIKPQKCIFVGSAIGMGERLGLSVKRWMGLAECPVLFIQQEKDPAISFKGLKKFVERSGLKDYKLVEVPGNDHMYKDVAGLADEIKSFVF